MNGSTRQLLDELDRLWEDLGDPSPDADAKTAAAVAAALRRNASVVPSLPREFSQWSHVGSKSAAFHDRIDVTLSIREGRVADAQNRYLKIPAP